MGAKTPTMRTLDPRAKPFPGGTIEVCEELSGDRSLPRHLRDRVQAVRLLALGRRTGDVAEVLGRGVSTIERHKRRFLAEGESYLTDNRYGLGRPRAFLTVEEETSMLEELRAAAGDGELVTVRMVREAILKRTGRDDISISTPYDMLHRHGWRKVAPRPTHPDGDPGRREAFKQTSLGGWTP